MNKLLGLVFSNLAWLDLCSIWVFFTNHCIYRSLSYEDLWRGWLHCQRWWRIESKLHNNYPEVSDCNLWWLDAWCTINARKVMNIIHVAGLQLSLSLVLIRIFFINLDWFCSMDTTHPCTTLGCGINQQWPFKGNHFGTQLKLVLAFLGWVFPNVHRLYSYRTREFSLRILLPNL